eukprot:550525_1
MKHQPSQYCECKECLIIFQSFHSWRKLKDLEKDIKNKAIASKAGSVAKTGTHLVTNALGIGGIAGKVIAYGVGAAAKTATTNAMKDDTFKQKQKLYRQNSGIQKNTKNTPKIFPHFTPILDEKELDDYNNAILSEKHMVNKLHKFDNDTVIMSLNTKVFGGWVEKKSLNLSRWRKRFLLVRKNVSQSICKIQTYKNTLQIDSLQDLQALSDATIAAYKTHGTTVFTISKTKFKITKVEPVRKANNLYVLAINLRNYEHLTIRCKSESAMKFWSELFTEIYGMTRYSGFEYCSRLILLKKNQQDDYVWRRLGEFYAIRGNVSETIRCYEHALNVCPKNAEILIYFIENLRNYFGDKVNDKQLQLYQKMESLYSYKYIDYENYCVLLYKMEKYETLNTILLNIEIMNHVNISVEER